MQKRAKNSHIRPQIWLTYAEEPNQHLAEESNQYFIEEPPFQQISEMKSTPENNTPEAKIHKPLNDFKLNCFGTHCLFYFEKACHNNAENSKGMNAGSHFLPLSLQRFFLQDLSTKIRDKKTNRTRKNRKILHCS